MGERHLLLDVGSDGEKNCDAAFGVAVTEVTVVA